MGQSNERRDNPTNGRDRPAASWLRTGLRLLVLAAVAALFWVFLAWARDVVAQMHTIAGHQLMAGLLVASLVAYAILIALPFMPGIEVGVALLMLHGAKIAPFVYLATVCGLMTAYLVGRTIPLPWMHAAFRDIGATRACNWIETIQSTPAPERLRHLQDRLPPRAARWVVGYRYVMIGTLLNVPGTFAIGGGGGILLLAGITRLFTGWKILLTLLIATSPVPLTVWLMGTQVLQ